jgi:hypothetical protein
MPRQTKPARRCAPQQVDLFAAEPQTTTGGMPAWSGLSGTDQLDDTIDPGACHKNQIGSIAEAGHDL